MRTATASMTSVPKPLKFLRAHYTTFKTIHADIPDIAHKVRMIYEWLDTPIGCSLNTLY